VLPCRTKRTRRHTAKKDGVAPALLAVLSGILGTVRAIGVKHCRRRSLSIDNENRRRFGGYGETFCPIASTRRGALADFGTLTDAKTHIGVMTHLDMPDDLAVQPSSAQIDDYRGARQLQKLKRRLRRRVVHLRIQAYSFLALAIFLLLGGVAVFGWANYIARFTLSPPQTAASQYEKLTADRKRLGEQRVALDKQQQETLATITGPYTEKIAKIKAEYMPLEEDILRNCPKAILNNYIDSETAFGWFDQKVTSGPRIGDFGFRLPSGKSVSFEALDLANECRSHFEEHREKLIQYTRNVQGINAEQVKIIQENLKLPELAAVNEQRGQVMGDIQDVDALLKDARSRVAQEKYLGIAPAPEGHASENTEAKIDWPHVIETNATRIGVLAAMFFLVTILVPQYRYSIKMANFYQARYDSLEILPDKIVNEDFDRVVSIMSPNIDFGKSPPTPWEHILEVVKAAK